MKISYKRTWKIFASKQKIEKLIFSWDLRLIDFMNCCWTSNAFCDINYILTHKKMFFSWNHSGIIDFRSYCWNSNAFCDTNNIWPLKIIDKDQVLTAQKVITRIKKQSAASNVLTNFEKSGKQFYNGHPVSVWNMVAILQCLLNHYYASSSLTNSIKLDWIGEGWGGLGTVFWIIF